MIRSQFGTIKRGKLKNIEHYKISLKFSVEEISKELFCFEEKKMYNFYIFYATFSVQICA